MLNCSYAAIQLNPQLFNRAVQLQDFHCRWRSVGQWVYTLCYVRQITNKYKMHHNHKSFQPFWIRTDLIQLANITRGFSIWESGVGWLMEVVQQFSSNLVYLLSNLRRKLYNSFQSQRDTTSYKCFISLNHQIQDALKLQKHSLAMTEHLISYG